ncbi:MAG TPA: DUF3459 domain-containing protein, partial [Rhizomicrobium sp.]|nr:DUF3459 domain-containing protein [Rhizomicrobium sp.]
PHAGFSAVEPWLPIPEDHVRRAVSGQNGDADSVLTVARELMELRRSSPLLRYGAFRSLELEPPLLGFDRVRDDGLIRCIFNLGKAAVSCDAPREGRILFSTGAVDQQAGRLGPLAACILEP